MVFLPQTCFLGEDFFSIEYKKGIGPDDSKLFLTCFFHL